MSPHTCRAALLMLLLGSAAAQAEIVDIAWSGDGRFAHQLRLAPGKFAEVCGKLQRKDAVAWQFNASGPLAFNIHYHLGRDVHYPERRDAAASASGQLQVAVDHDHCWMWTNKSAQAIDLQLQLAR